MSVPSAGSIATSSVSGVESTMLAVGYSITSSSLSTHSGGEDVEVSIAVDVASNPPRSSLTTVAVGAVADAVLPSSLTLLPLCIDIDDRASTYCCTYSCLLEGSIFCVLERMQYKANANADSRLHMCDVRS